MTKVKPEAGTRHAEGRVRTTCTLLGLSYSHAQCLILSRRALTALPDLGGTKYRQALATCSKSDFGRVQRCRNRWCRGAILQTRTQCRLVGSSTHKPIRDCRLTHPSHLQPTLTSFGRRWKRCRKFQTYEPVEAVLAARQARSNMLSS